MKRITLFFFLSFAGTAQTGFNVAGIVTNGLTGQPIRKADVVLAPVSGPSLHFLTNADGKFQFQVPEGKYNLSAAAPGIWRQGFGGRSGPIEIGVSLYVNPAQDNTKRELKLFPPGVIRGKVKDQAGDPVETALVELFRVSIVAGRKSVRSYRTQYSNDRGEYAFGQLSPGRYYVAASGTPWYRWTSGDLNDQTSRQQAQVAFGMTFYPDVAEPSAASPLVIASGKEAVADFVLSPVAGHSLSVKCEGACKPTMVDLLREGVGGTFVYQKVANLTAFGGFGAVPPGHYKIRIRAPEGQPGYVGMTDVDVISQDVTATIKYSDTAVISGMVTPENGDVSVLAKMQVRFQSVQDPQLVFARSVQADGHFTSPPLLPGKYRIYGPVLDNWYFKLVRNGEEEGKVIPVGESGVSGIKIVASPATVHIKGTVLQDGKPVYGAIVSFSREGADRDDMDMFRGFQTDSDGSFYFNNLAPGKYRLFAVMEGNFEYGDPDTLQPYLASATVIEAGPGDRFTEKIEVITKKP